MVDINKYEKLKQAILNASMESEKIDEGNNHDTETLAYALLSIENSCKEIVEKIIPQIIEKSASEIDLTMFITDIGDELRNIIDQIKATERFGYLQELLKMP